ncbi:MAG TPA: hypothetical protein VFW40_14350 [Capsulimonadaceae bacterium]|nr:hypothetical protein [Capsulimonadaceae bacterium]
MVRSNTPLPFVFRFRPASKERPSDAPTALPPKLARRRRALAIAAPSPLQNWRDFVARYEEFTDVLCIAAKDGCTERREARYALLRCWLMENYYAISPRLRPFLAQASARADEKFTMVEPISGRRRPLDSFEMLFTSNTLTDLLARDQGGLIEHVTRISDAVYSCDWRIAADAAGK